MPFHVGREIARLIGRRIDPRARRGVIAGLHDIIDEAIGFVAADVEDVDEPRMRPRDRRVFLQPLELAVERHRVRERRAAHDFRHVEIAEDIARQPHLAVRTASDAADKLVVGHRRQGR